MATSAVAQRRESRVKEYTYLWEGVDRNNRNVRGETKGASETVVTSSLSQAFREHPGQFDMLYCNLVHAGETAGILDGILERLATYKEKILAIKSKIKSALFYPISVVTVAIIVVWVIMVWVIPAFKQVFTSFGANLPAPTLIVIGISDFFVAYWWLMAAIIAGALITFFFLLRRSAAFRYTVDRISLKLPIIGGIVEKAT